MADVSTRPIAWSNGGGTQSNAIAILIYQGLLPKPAIAVIADTGREQQETWDYMESHTAPLLWAAGVELVVAPHTLATKDLYDSKGETLIPAYMPNDARKRAFCSAEWKREVVSRCLRSKGYGPQNPVRQWLGISTDEVMRASSKQRVNWIEPEYPLLSIVPMSRAECRQLVLDFGWPEPPHSSCYMCPHHSDAEWLHMKEYSPADWQRAIDTEQKLQGSRGVAQYGAYYLHKSRVPLEEVVFKGQGEGDIDGTCETEHCYV